MPKCPNCGQKTARTEDWVCQWCGYPLPSGGYKKIDKTYKQLKDEESFGSAPEEVEEKVVEPVTNPEPDLFPRRHTEPEVEPVLYSEPEPVPEPVPPPAPKPPTTSSPFYQSIVTPPRTSEPVSQTPPVSRAVEPRLEPKAEPTTEPAHIILPPPQAKQEQEHVQPQTTPEVSPQVTRVVQSEPAPAQTVPAQPEQVARPASPPPQPEPTTAPQRPNPLLTQPAIPDNLEISTAEIAAAYQADKAASDAKLKNKTIRVTGTIGKMVIREHLDIVYIILTDSRHADLWNLRCTFDKKYGTQLRRFNLGDTVTIQGRYDGYERNIILKDCMP